jgi:hypothetical protein
VLSIRPNASTINKNFKENIKVYGEIKASYKMKNLKFSGHPLLKF